tara:strand:- start:3794 stop:5158 length:1365 start_codon:yes stop_codon:yes gene_type:complete
MVLNKLGESLKNSLQKIAKSIFVDEKLLNELIKDIQRALLESDVNVHLVFDLTKRIKEKALEEDTPGVLSKKEHLINIVYDELVKFLGEDSKFTVKAKPFRIMLVGLFGNGKTTTAGKLANYFSKRGSTVAMIGLDVHRPAAIDQIKQLGDSINIPVFIDKTEKDPLNIWKKNQKELDKFDIVIVDTAGRDALSQDLVEEIETLNAEIKPAETLLVMSADIGQTAQKQAEQFHKSCSVTGVVITKMDGTAKGGGALTACSACNVPVIFIGTGEKVGDIEQFNPKGFVGRLLGMGDITALLDKAKEAISEEDAEDLGKRLLKGDFNLIDLYEQMIAMKKMGPLNKIVDMIPGFSQLKLPKEALQVQEGKLEKWRYAMNSCTKGELEEPDNIDRARIERISKGSGISIKDVHELIKQYKQSKKLVKMFKGKGEGDIGKMMKKFGGAAGGGMPKLKF